MISVPSGGLVPLSNPNQSVMNMLGVPKYTVNTCLVLTNLIYNILVGLNFPKEHHLKPTTYINVMRGKGVEEIGLSDKMK
jgi:hypothetical protein